MIHYTESIFAAANIALGYRIMTDYAKDMRMSAMELVKLSNGLPKGETFATQMLDKDVKDRFTMLNSAINTVLDNLAKKCTNGEVKRAKSGNVAGLLGDFIDVMCDKIDELIAPKKKSPIPFINDQSKSDSVSVKKVTVQKNWQPDNYNQYRRFVPPNFSKNFSSYPLPDEWKVALENPEAYRLNELAPILRNPYEQEIQGLNYKAVFSGNGHNLFKVKAPMRPNEDKKKIKLIDNKIDLEEYVHNISQLEYIDTETHLEKCVNEILDETIEGGAVAIDVEHSSKSFKGFSCLIQLSTRRKDYIIDPFKIYNVVGQHLNKITANPNIIKVLHGSDSDVIWLQRDFGCYLVGMFDTFRAARRLLISSGLSLVNLLKVYCGITLNKEQQQSDWTIRPLSKEQLEYARQDTHSLLFLFDCMKNHLLLLPENAGETTIRDLKTDAIAGEGESTESGCAALIEVLQESAKCAANYFEDGLFDISKAVALALKKASVNAYDAMKNKSVLEAILTWRDSNARCLDIDTSQIISDFAVTRIAANPPKSISALVKEVNTKSFNSHKLSLASLLEAITEAASQKSDSSSNHQPGVLSPTNDTVKPVKRSNEVGEGSLDEEPTPKRQRNSNNNIVEQIVNESFLTDQARRKSSSVQLVKKTETRRKKILELESGEKAAELAFELRRTEIQQKHKTNGKRFLSSKTVNNTAFLKTLNCSKE